MRTPFDNPVGLFERLTYPLARTAYEDGHAAGVGSATLHEFAERIGLDGVDAAEEAITIGARFKAHGFEGYEIDHMIMRYYQEQARVKALHECDPSAKGTS